MDSSKKKGIPLIVIGILSFFVLPVLVSSIMSSNMSYTSYSENAKWVAPICYGITAILLFLGVRKLIQSMPKTEDDQSFDSVNQTDVSISSALPGTNKVVNVTLTGGIIGMFGGSPHGTLNRIIKRENQKGWKVIQIIPSDQGNLFISILRFIVLIVTLFFYTTASGYYIIMEKS